MPDEPYVLNYLAYSWLERNINIDVVGAWTETVTQNKTESAKIHQMNAEEQDINGNTINLN